MMFEEDDVDHQTGNDNEEEEEEEGMNSGGRAQGEIGGLPVGYVSPAAVVAALSEYLPHSKDQAQKNRRGQSEKIFQLEEGNQREKDDLEAGVLHGEPGTLRTHSTSCQQESTDLDGAFENGSPFAQVPEGISNQEDGIALSSTKKHSDIFTCTVAGEQQVTPESSGTVVTIQDDFPPFSGSRYNKVKSNTETQSTPGAEERMYRKPPDKYPGGGEGRNVVAQMPWISSLTEQDAIKGENDARLHPSGRLSQNPWENNCQEQGKERGIAIDQQEKVKMAESVIPTKTPAQTGELVDKFGDCQSSSVNPSEMVQSAGNAVKELVHTVVPHEPKVKHGQKYGPPKKNLYSKTQVIRTVSGSHEIDNYLEENRTCRKRSLSSSDQAKEKLRKCKMKESDQSPESVRMDTTLKKASSEADVILVSTNVGQIQPSLSPSSTGPDPVNPVNEKPKKKMGRPKKKCEYIVTKKAIGILEADCSASVKECSQKASSPKDFRDKKTLETTVSVRKKKRGRGKYIRKPVCIIPTQEQVVGMVIESTAETLSPSRIPHSVQDVIGGKWVKGPEYKVSAILDLKATTAPTPVGCSPHEQKKRGRRKKIVCLTSNSFEPQNCSVPQVMLPPSKIKTELEEMAVMSTSDRKGNGTVKERTGVVGQCGDGGSIAVGYRNRAADEKLKRKIGRPFKKKTLIKMAKQLALAQVRTANATDMFERNHPENIPLHHPQKCKLKRERKKVELYSPVSPLRRYSRACKLNANYSDEKQEHHPASIHNPLSSSVSDITVAHLGTGKTVSRYSAVLSKKDSETTKSEGHDRVKVTWKKAKHLKNNRKCQVNIKVEEIQPPVLTEFSKIQNPSAFQERLPMLSKDTLSSSESVHSTEKTPLKNWQMRSKARQIDQLRSSTESGQSLSTQSLHQRHNDSAAGKDKVPLVIPKEEIEETPNTAATENKVMSHKDTRTGTMKKFRRKGRMSQKKEIAKIKYKPTLDAAMSNVSASKNKYDSHSKFLPPTQRLIESNISGDKGSRRRGRPCKNKAMIPTVKSSEDIKKEMVELVMDQSYPSQKCPLKPPGEVISCLNISTDSETKRPRKVDKRRKRFRRLKALELKASSEVLLKPPVPVGKFTSQIDHREDVHYISQTHSNKRKLEADDQLFNDSDPFTKRARKAFGSRKKRRRKRSWWDDRGKDKGVLTEKYPDSTLKPALLSVEGKAEVAVIAKTDFDVKVTANQQSITSYQHEMQNSDKLPSHTQAVAQISGTDRISGEEEFSEKIGLSTEETNTEKSCGYQENSELQKNDFLNETEGVLFHDISISENESWVSNPENQNDQNLAVNISGPLPESCKGTVGLVTDELQEKQVSDEMVTPSSHALNKEVNVLETDSPEPDELLKADITRHMYGRSRNEVQQKQIVTNEKNILRDESVMLIPKEADSVEKDVEMFASSESKTLNITNLRPSETLDEECGLSDVFPNTPDVEKNQSMSLQQNVSIQDLPSDKTGWGKYQDGVEQSDQELEEEGCIEEDAAESMAEELPLSIHSKIRGPGRPPKDKEKTPIECQFCGRAFHHISAYIIHRRVHTGERPYSCQECGKTFAQLSNLNSHRKTHKLPDDPCRMFSDQEERVHFQKNAEGLNRQCLTRQIGNEEDGDKNEHRSFPSLKDRKPHGCSVCGKGFRYSSMLKIHMRVHSGEKPYSCKICGKSFSQACSVRVHEKIHWSVKPYICNLCGKGFSQLGTLRTHFYSHTGMYTEVYTEGGKLVSNKVIFQCRTCHKSFSIWHQYNFHLKSHIDVQFSACDICGQQFRQISDLSFHRQSCGKQTIKDTVHPSDTWQKSQKQKGLPFRPHPIQHPQLQSNHQYQPLGQQQTGFLNYTIAQQQVNHLPEHKTFPELMNPQPQRDASQQRNHSSINKCRQIASPAYSQMIIKSPRKRYHSRHALSTSAHLDRKFDPRKYLCPRCGRLFRHLGRLRAHMLTHVRGHSYTCGRCGKTLENWNKFWLHQRIHRQKRGRFFCPKCGQGFRFAGMYKQHLQEHELRVYACSSCPQTFSHGETLKAHQRDQHKPHKCNVCGKSFHLQGNLQRHNLVHRHTHPECCPHCSLLFPDISGLQDHIITHTNPTGPLLDVSAQQNVLPYQCGECEASFKNLDLLFRHQLCHSPPRDRKPWRNGEIVGLQNKSLRVFTPLDDTSVYPSSSSSDPQVSALYTDPSAHQQGSQISHTNYPDHSELASNKPSQPSKFPSLENNTNLPQTLSPCTAVPFSEAQPLSLPQYPQTCTPAQSPSHKQVQTPPKFGKSFTQKPLRTYEKSKRGSPSAPSTSEKPQSEDDSRDSVECAECGAQFNLVPELFEHYLQHARGEL